MQLLGSTGSQPSIARRGGALRQQPFRPVVAKQQTPQPGNDNGASKRSAPSTRTNAATNSNGAPSSSNSEEAKLALAAKISAARTLARKLAEEKQAAAAATKLGSSSAVAPEAAAEMIRSAEAEVADMAREAAKADNAARAARKATPQLAELQRLKEENAALQELVMQLASNRQEAERRLKDVQEKGLAAVLTGVRSSFSDEEESNSSSGGRSTSKSTTIPNVSGSQLLQLVATANSGKQRSFVLPDGPVSAGSTVRVFYNRQAGPLPSNNIAMEIKLGYNKWEKIVQTPMKRQPELDAEGGGEWWSVDIDLPKFLFKVDFVMVESKSGAVDNNGAKDFQLELAGAPTEAAVQAERLLILQEFEEKMQARYAAEEDAIYKDWMAQAEKAAQEARKVFAKVRKEKLLQEARAVVEERRGLALEELVLETSQPGVFMWAKAPDAGGSPRMFYNKAAGKLRDVHSVVMHVGYDNWWMQDKRIVPMAPVDPAVVKKNKLPEGEWWGADVPLWNTAAVVDFAFTNDARSVWDNNGGTDYHTALTGAASGEKLVQLVFQALETAGASETAKQERLAAKRVLNKAALQANSGRKQRDLQRQFLFTEPTNPKAGSTVKVYYNPERTVLRGRPDVFIRGSFNRWVHPQCFLPQQMVPAVPEAGGLGFLQAEVEIPKDAHVLDVCFLDSNDTHGGFYDNNRGLDYHIPVVGSTTKSKALRVVHVAAEMAPIAKAGGLGDVVTALSRAVQEEGHSVEVILPKYDAIDYKQVEGLKMTGDFFQDNVQVKIWKGIVEGLNTTFLEPCNGSFWVGSIYTDMNADRGRFGFFCICATTYLKSLTEKVDIVHCHDWQSAPIAAMDRNGAACAFTIHNMNYGADLIGLAMTNSDVCTTVSPTYATEISGHPAIAPHHDKFFGIRNGIDMDIWDPANDPFLPVGYTSENSDEGKAAAKAELRARMGLVEADVPVVGCVTRLTHQKGIHLIKHAAWRAMERGAQFVLLGSAPDPKVQAEFTALAADLTRQYPERAKLWFAYDEPLSHLIYAGSDMFLVPSMFEPCGLTQMIAMRYGTVPVVRKTGGLNDTVFDVDHDIERAEAAGLGVNGFSFEGMDAPGMDYALNRALAAWYDREEWRNLSVAGMEMDWSWGLPGKEYIELYYRALKPKM